MDDESFSTTRSLATIVRLAATSKSVLLQPALSYSAVKRLITVSEDEEITPNDESDDILGEEICSAAEELSFTERHGSNEVSVSPALSIAALFDADSKEARDLKPRLFLGWDISGEPSIVAMLTACEFARDDSLGTSKFDRAYFDQHNIPRLTSSNALFIDVISSSGEPHGVGALLALSCYLTVCRSKKYQFLCSVAVSVPGQSLFQRLGFHSHSFRQGTQRHFCWVRAGELTASDINRRLRVDRSIPDICWRQGYTARNRNSKYPRC